MDLRKDEDRAALADEFGPMETEPSEYTVDRTGWPAGPWDGEPDYLEWKDEESGLWCVMERGKFGAWSGFVGVPLGSRWYGMLCRDVEIAVHGGLTSCGFQWGVKSMWWFGFSCNHGYDFQPMYGALMKLSGRVARAYKDVAFVKEECRKLAGQLK